MPRRRLPEVPFSRSETPSRNSGTSAGDRRVIAFGSFLSDKEKLGDVDLAVTLERRESDSDRYDKLAKERVDLVASKGRTFSTFMDMLFWPEQEVILHLKGRSRYLKLHSDQDGVLKKAQTRVLYELTPPGNGTV